MQLRNHIAHRFLTDRTLIDEIMKTYYPEEYEYAIRNSKELGPDSELINKLANLHQLSSFDDQTAYYVTDSVLKSLSVIKVSSFDWTIFKDVDTQKNTYIFNDNSCVRIYIHHDLIEFMNLKYTFYTKEERLKYKDKKNPGHCMFTKLYVDRKTNEISSHFHSKTAVGMQEKFYKLLMFFFFAQPEQRIVNGQKSYGSKKQPDALDNSTNFPVTIINSNWNITSIRTEGFEVSGHMRLQACGAGRKDHRFVFINPYKKNGYVRKAKKSDSI